MSEFVPIYPAHAIERCAAMVTFNPPVPAKAFKRLADASIKVMSELGFTAETAGIGIQFNAATGDIRQISDDLPVRMHSADRQEHLIIAPDHLIWTTQLYIRWQPFRKELERVTKILLPLYDDVVDISSVKLEYLDRFFWTGTWEDMAVDQLLRTDTEFVSPAAFHSQKEWHSHVGWFDYRSSFRRLTNINVDVVSAQRPNEPEQPSVSILTMHQDQADQKQLKEFGEISTLERFDELHRSLKNYLQGVLANAMCKRIGLGK